MTPTPTPTPTGETEAQKLARLRGGNSPTVQSPTVQGAGGAPNTSYNGAGGFDYGAGPSTAADDTTLIQPKATDKQFSEASIYKQLDAGMINDEQAAALFRQIGYDENEAKTMVALNYVADKKAAPGLSLSNIFEARDRGLIDDAEVQRRLAAGGFAQADIDILSQIGAKQRAEDAQKKYDATHRDPGEGSLWNAYDAGAISADEMHGRLAKLGYNDSDISSLIRWQDTQNSKSSAEKAAVKAEQAKRQAEADAKQAERDRRANAQRAISNIPNAPRALGPTGGDVARGAAPDPLRIYNDFRTNFAASLKNQSAGVSGPAKKWAMDNMDSFLPSYLQSATDQGVFSLGAQQIQQAFEGSRGTQRAVGRAGIGTQQVRSI